LRVTGNFKFDHCEEQNRPLTMETGSTKTGAAGYGPIPAKTENRPLKAGSEKHAR
jgi:hypothetical protein